MTFHGVTRYPNIGVFRLTTESVVRKLLHKSCRRGSISSSLIRSITSYGIFYGRRHSFIGRNINFCLHRYKCSLADFTSGRLRYIIENSYNASVSEETRVKITFIEERIYNRDLLSKGTLRQFCLLSTCELKDIIDYLCTS